MSDRDISRIQLELLPMVQDIVIEWLIIQFLAATPTQGPMVGDFSTQLSSLNIGNFLSYLHGCRYEILHLTIS